MQLNELNGPQKRVLREALLAAFNPASLDMLLVENDKPSLAVLVAPSAFEQQVFELIKRTQSEGWTDRVVEWAQDKSGNVRIKNLIHDLSLLDVDGDPRLVKSGGKGSLERTVKEKAGISNFMLWADKLMQLRATICRIEDPDDPRIALGTGFLVSDDLILTNYHVVDKYIDVIDPSLNGVRQGDRLKCRFDYIVESSGTNAGTVVPLAPGKAWLVDHSRFSKFDPGDQGGTPDATELDYALLRLREPIGNAQAPTASGKRGWIPVSTLVPVPEPTDILFIVQHPKGDPLKLAVGTVIAQNKNGTRLRYDTNTAGGSSGSPCFDANLDLVALHHGGDPSYAHLAKFNQGIPVARIVKHVAERSVVQPFWQQ